MKEGGGGGEGRNFLPSFLPHPLPAYSRHFSRGLFSETARKRLLRRLLPVRLSDAQENDSYMTNFLRDTTGS